MMPPLDWSQLGWVAAGFFLFTAVVVLLATRNLYKKGQQLGHDLGWHERQHWETDAIVKGKLERP